MMEMTKEYLGVSYSVKNIPALDPGFIPFSVWADAYRKGAAVSRPNIC